MTAREARLKPQYASEYPGIPPNTWMPARELAKSLVARVHARRKEGRFTRTFDPTHFEFRGGDTVARPRRPRTRSSDRAKTEPQPLLGPGFSPHPQASGPQERSQPH